MLAARLAIISGREIGRRYGLGSVAIGWIRGRMSKRPDALEAMESLTRQPRKKPKHKARADSHEEAVTRLDEISRAPGCCDPSGTRTATFSHHQ